MWKHLLSRPTTLLVTTFAGLILVGTVLLSLPCSQAEVEVGPLDALFTATSAVCVTGLNTVDGGAASFSRTGQTIVLVLIQLGGLGIMTFGALVAQIFRRRVSFGSQAALEDAFFQGQARGDLKTALRRIVGLVFVCELLGAILLYVGIGGSDVSADTPVYDAVFLSVSAFCNAGFSVYSDSVESFDRAPLVLATLMVLITVGGLGYTVMFELLGRAWRRVVGRRDGPVRLTLNTRVVLGISLLLSGGGAVALLVTGVEAGYCGWGERTLHALFQSVTARTAGFNSTPIGALSVPALLILMPLMFVGGSPGSCAGGVKTTSLAVWGARVSTRLAGREHVNIGDRHVPHDIVRRAALIMAVAVLWNAIGVLLLASTETVGDSLVRFEHIIFEQVSAFATVGLSAGLTTELSTVGKLWIIATMFVGRLGPLTIAFAVMHRPPTPVTYPTERLMVG